MCTWARRECHNGWKLKVGHLNLLSFEKARVLEVKIQKNIVFYAT